MSRVLHLSRVLGVALVVVSILWGGGSAVGQTPPVYQDVRPIPETPALKRALEVMEVVNSGDPARVRRLTEEAFQPEAWKEVPAERHVQVFEEVREANGRFVPEAARTYTPPRADTDAVLIVWSEREEAWRAISVSVEEAPPHRITSLGFNAARQPTGLPPAPALDTDGVAKELGGYLDRLVKGERFSGTVILARGGKTLLSRAAGIANRDFDAPITIDTKFNLGSMNKMFTGCAVMKLVEQGRLSLDDPISKYLDDSWLPKVDKSKVQVKHLLTHTSGLGSYFNETYDQSSRLLFRNVEDYKALVAEETLAFEPGSKWAYSNSGMLIAGAVIEKASGMDYFEFVRREITGPAGMTGTDCYELDRVNKNLAVGYHPQRTAEGIVWRNNVFDHVMRGGPAGGGYSTAPDLLRFDAALRGRTFLSDSSVRELWTARPDLHSENYGLGFGVDEGVWGKRVGHSGGFIGINSQLDMYLDTGWTVIVMSNTSGGAGPVAAKAAELIARVPRE